MYDLCEVYIGPKDYRVDRIDGDYAHLTDLAAGEDLLVALALLPPETDEGVVLHWENLIYSVKE